MRHRSALATCVAVLSLTACRAESEPATNAVSVSSEAVQATASPVDPESDAIFADVKNLYFDREGTRMSLRTLDAWVKRKPDGQVRWGLQDTPRGQIIMVAVTYTYDTGELADVAFLFGPINGTNPLALAHAYRGEQPMSEAEALSILDGFMLDMYHQGMIAPGG